MLTNVPADAGDIAGLVYVAAFALDAGESPGDVAGSAPGGTLGETLAPVPLPGGGTDLYIDQAKYHDQFCADLPESQGRLMAVTQRPIAEAALGEASGPTPLWRSVPSWFIYGDADRNIPSEAHQMMAERASSKGTRSVAGASHVVGMSHAAETAGLILEAAGGSTS